MLLLHNIPRNIKRYVVWNKFVAVNIYPSTKVPSRVGRRSLVRFQVLTATSMKFRVFWNILPCSQIDFDRRFRVAYGLHHRPDDGGRTHL
jgi:hypothetical protein